MESGISEEFWHFMTQENGAVSPIKMELTKLRSDALQIPNRERAIRAADGQKIVVGAPGQAMDGAILFWEGQ